MVKVLIVDDSASDRSILRQTFQVHGCEVVEAENGREGLAKAGQFRPDLIISDALMPVLDGFGFLREIKCDKVLSGIPFIFYSAVYTGYDEERLARSQGAAAFLLKPMDPVDLWQEIQVIMDSSEAGPSADIPAALGEEEQYLRDYSHIVVAKLEEKVSELEAMFVRVVQVLVNLLDAKSPWTMGHSERVAEHARDIAREMGLDENRVSKVYLGALLHDIGKIGTYDTLLNKLSALTEAEYQIVKGHPGRGADALEAIDQLKEVIPMIRYHHEKYDGTGYPDHLKHDEIPLAARIISVADTYDSITVTRPYRVALDTGNAIAELRRSAGSQLDPAVVQVFIKFLENSESTDLAGKGSELHENPRS